MNTRAGLVALIGAPNAGKSTLLNALIGSKLAIVTPKPQTTRGRITGVMVHKNTQVVFLDTPGIFKAPQDFEKAMVKEAWRGADEADIVALLIDASVFARRKALDEEVQAIVRQVGKRECKLIVLLNKTDRTPKETLLLLAQEIDAALKPKRIFMISALKQDGLKDVKDYLAAELPESPWLYPEDHLTDIPERVLAAEITREKLFLRLRDELPYALMVETEKWEEFKDGSVKIHQVVVVEKESHKKIVLGAKGAMLKAIGESARRDIGKQLDRKVHLFLFVKVKEDWKRDENAQNLYGL